VEGQVDARCLQVFVELEGAHDLEAFSLAHQEIESQFSMWHNGFYFTNNSSVYWIS
jgi:hypothetical protein